MGKHADVERWEKYSDDGELDGQRCPKCRALLAQHDNRKSCGKCGFSKIEK